MEQIDLFSSPVVADVSPSSVSSPASFGCCSLYRSCSDARQCLAADQPYSSNCAYRRNLEAGRIFYGTNANGFSYARLSEYQRQIDGLPSGAQQSLDELLVDFCEYHRGALCGMVRNHFISEMACVGLFQFSPLGSAFFPRDDNGWNYKKVCGLVSQHADYSLLFECAQDVRKKLIESEKMRGTSEKDLPAGPNTKRFLREWLNGEGSPLRDEIAAPYRLVSPLREADLYIEELYRIRLLPSYDSRVYSLSPLAADGFLSDSALLEEEMRRVKLSRGMVK